MSKWVNFIKKELSNINFDKVEQDSPSNLFLLKNNTYLSFEISKTGTLEKTEAGKYWFNDNKETDFEVSHVKAVLDLSKPNNLNFLQVSYFSEYGKDFELEFNEENKIILKQFLDIPLKTGWQELNYKYNEDHYKTIVKIYLTNKPLEFEILLLNFAEQDIPLPGDKTDKKIRSWWADLNFNKNKRKVNQTNVHPMIKHVA